jgi:hypothetical protein
MYDILDLFPQVRITDRPTFQILKRMVLVVRNSEIPHDAPNLPFPLDLTPP